MLRASNLVQSHAQWQPIEWASPGLLRRYFRFIQTIEGNIAGHDNAVGDGKLPIELDCRVAFSHCFLVLSKHGENYARQESMGKLGARISVYPKLAFLLGLFHVSG